MTFGGMVSTSNLKGETMNLLFRPLRFLAVSIFNFLLSLFIVILMHLLLPVVLVVFRAVSGLIAISFAATVNDPRQFADRLASEWTRRILASGGDLNRIDQIYGFCRFMAGTTIVLGWVLSIVFTVTVLRVVFGFFI
jgi:hypothetical protein